MWHLKDDGDQEASGTLGQASQRGVNAQSLVGFKCRLDSALKNILEPFVSPEVGLGDQGRFLPTEIFYS